MEKILVVRGYSTNREDVNKLAENYPHICWIDSYLALPDYANKLACVEAMSALVGMVDSLLFLGEFNDGAAVFYAMTIGTKKTIHIKDDFPVRSEEDAEAV